MKTLALLRYERDMLITKLWLVLNDISKYRGADRMTDQDLDVWGAVTKHSGVQKKLQKT